VKPISNSFLCAFILLCFFCCKPTNILYEEDTRIQAVTLKVDMQNLIFKSDSLTYQEVKTEIEKINRELQLSYEYQKAIDPNSLRTQQYENLLSDNHFYKTFLNAWKTKGKLKTSVAQNTSERIDEIMDQIIELESGKIKGGGTTRTKPPKTNKELYPSFPTFPPKASASKVLPRNLFIQSTSKSNLDFAIRARLVPALDNAGYEYKFFLYRDSGIALVTELEKINLDGTSDSQQRYSTKTNRITTFNIFNYLRSLFVASPGYYRVIVFIFSPYPIVQSQLQINKFQFDSIYTAGSDRPYLKVLPYEFSKDYECTAFIYEFIKPNKEDPPYQENPSPITCQLHLEKSGILSNLSNQSK
jgi:hypothetical protein